MTLPISPNSISLSQVNTELGYSSTAIISMNDSAVRMLFGKASGSISMSDGHGKANTFSFTIASNQTNANLRTLAVNAGWNQASAVVATISSGVQITSTSTGTPALTVSGSFPGGVTLINNGTIVGRGGTGGRGGHSQGGTGQYSGYSGAAGGLGLSVSTAVSINNANVIGGGGGGGGGGGLGSDLCTGADHGGGGGGGGAGFGTGGAYGYWTTTNTPYFGVSGSTGGLTSGGSGGAGNSGIGGNGGAGGSSGASGSGGGSGSYWGPNGGAGAAGGGAVTGNSNITWLATGTRYGSIS